MGANPNRYSMMFELIPCIYVQVEWEAAFMCLYVDAMNS